jgi:hypothetical protein
MMYAVRDDLTGWREVLSEVDLRDSEHLEINRPTFLDAPALMQLSRAEVKLRLAELGILVAIEQAIAEFPIDNRLRIRWENAQYFERLDTDLIMFCTDYLGWSESEIDDFFTGNG